jgi:hypothetical protein
MPSVTDADGEANSIESSIADAGAMVTLRR